MSNTAKIKDVEIDFIITNVKGQSKKAVLENIMSYIAQNVAIAKNAPLERLFEKEEFESCAIGHGVAVPHVRVSDLGHPVTILARLENPVDFGADDNIKVDLVSLVLSPSNSGAFRLIRVSRVQRLLSNNILCNAIREAKDEDAIHNVIYNPEGWLMAA